MCTFSIYGRTRLNSIRIKYKQSGSPAHVDNFFASKTSGRVLYLLGIYYTYGQIENNNMNKRIRAIRRVRALIPIDFVMFISNITKYLVLNKIIFLKEKQTKEDGQT